MTDTDALLRLARATLADIKDASDGDVLRACDTLIQHGDPDERRHAAALKTRIDPDIEDDGFVTIHPPLSDDISA